MKRTAIVIDLDGTLVDSVPDLRAALNALLAEEGRPALSVDEVKGMVGDGATKLVERGFAATGAAADADALAALVRRFLGLYEGHAALHTRPYPGVPETLRRLSAEGLRLGICTNKPYAATLEVLEALDLRRFFAVVTGGDSLNEVRKPDPRMLLTTLARMDATPEAAVMVGDNANDVAVAHGAGVPVIAVTYGYPKMPPERLGADLLIDRFDQLPTALARLDSPGRAGAGPFP